MRLNRYLALCGVASRRQAESFITAGRVTVNGQVATLGCQVDEKDMVCLDGAPLAPEAHAYYLFYKPVNMMTTLSDPQGRSSVGDVVATLPQHVVPVGRLDYDSEGLLLLTNDGDMTNAITHPSHGLEKTYRAFVRGTPDPAAINHLRTGVVLDDGKKTWPARVAVRGKWAGGAILEIILHEGRNRQVRRMCEAVGHPVYSLKRTQVGPLGLGTMKPGQIRPLTPGELLALRRACGLM
nr:pseudouridine synthase [bacterium]